MRFGLIVGLICYDSNNHIVWMVISMKYSILPIGHIEKNGSEVSLVISKAYWDATTHLELFSHVIILWWIDGRDNPLDRQTILVTPSKKKGLEQSGVFACRSPARPNPIGLTVVKIEGIDPIDNRIIVDHMDANSGSPIIDIKPYLPSSDRVENAKVPPWFNDLIPRYY
ncbi:tRNA (N6-threonylcarbamoyladenosine(37)-N6)-methyltransferase TrmO [Candidatus Thorarchaeota archaeon]|nr:MAG: tRNA (N6-threonylcarbamoyladenosine(37)-N6)-methyltransferase TrmO [Candidatus Thorarchaeota archaeon]